MKRAHQARRRMILLLMAFVISATVIGTLVYRKYELSRLKPAQPQPRESGAMLVTLFFASPDGTGLGREAREIDACTAPDDCATDMLEELVNGPVGDMSPSLPPVATIRSVQLHGDMATIDLGKEFPEGLPAGSNAQIMAFYSMVDTLAFNIPSVKKVKFLLEGAPVEHLGELDLRTPLTPDYSLEKKQ